MIASSRAHPPTTVVLDMDGTLLDLHFDDQVWNHRLPGIVAARRGCALETAKDYVATSIAAARGTLDWYCLDYWGALFDVSIHAIERELAELIRPRPGTLEFLQHLDAHGIRAVLASQPAGSPIRWRAAFAQAEGRRDEAREALREALEGGDLAAARPLLDAFLGALSDDALAAQVVPGGAS